MGVRGGRGRQRLSGTDFIASEIGIAIEALRLQQRALRPEKAHPFDGEGAAMAQASKDAIGPKIAALEFAKRLVKGEIGVEGVNDFIKRATPFRQLGEEAVLVVRGEAELNPEMRGERER